MAEELQQHRRLAAIMFTDMVGYSALSQKNEALALELLNEHRKLLRERFAAHGGREIEAVGDGFFVEFPSALEGARCAVDIQRTLHDRNNSAPLERRIEVRIGLHLGDVVAQDTRVHGDGVNIAARIEPLAEPGGICLSEDVARQIQNKIELPLLRLGKADLKNIQMPVELYRLVLPWERKHLPGSQRLAFNMRQRQRRRALIGAGGLLAVGALAGGWAWRRAQTPAAPINNRIAVLPFVSMSSSTDDEYFADGITEELISRLSRVSGLEVIARTSVMTYKGKSKNITEIGRELNVGTVLEGSVRKAGEKLRITAQLIRVENEAHLWSDDYDRDLKDVFAIQKDIAERVAAGLQLRLVAAEKRQIEKKGTENPEAYTLYLKGIYHLNTQTREGLEKSIGYFERAKDSDPAYAQAFAGLASAYQVLGFFYLSPEEAYPKVKASAQRALDIDETLAEAHAPLASVKMFYDRDWTGAESEFKRSLALNPSYAWARSFYGMLLAAMGRLEEAKVEVKRAQELDPLSPIVTEFVGWRYFFARQYDQQLEEFRKIRDMDPNYFSVHWGVGNAYLMKGMYGEAVVEFQKWFDLTGGLPWAYACLGCTYAKAGQRDRALQLLQELKRRPQQSGAYLTSFTWLYSCLGEKDQAFEWLERAYVARAGMLVYLKVDPLYDGLRSDPRFAALVRRMGLKP